MKLIGLDFRQFLRRIQSIIGNIEEFLSNFLKIFRTSKFWNFSICDQFGKIRVGFFGSFWSSSNAGSQ